MKYKNIDGLLSHHNNTSNSSPAYSRSCRRTPQHRTRAKDPTLIFDPIEHPPTSGHNTTQSSDILARPAVNLADSAAA